MAMRSIKISTEEYKIKKIIRDHLNFNKNYY